MREKRGCSLHAAGRTSTVGRVFLEWTMRSGEGRARCMVFQTSKISSKSQRELKRADIEKLLLQVPRDEPVIEIVMEQFVVRVDGQRIRLVALLHRGVRYIESAFTCPWRANRPTVPGSLRVVQRIVVSRQRLYDTRITLHPRIMQRFARIAWMSAVPHIVAGLVARIQLGGALQRELDRPRCICKSTVPLGYLGQSVGRH